MPEVLDTSAVLAYLFNEPGGDVVGLALDGSMIAAPNAAEVVSVLMGRGSSESDAIGTLRQIEAQIVPLDEALALRTGSLVAITRDFGLSLGDCACIALGEASGATILTADRDWERLDLNVRIRLIR